jgi:hypothetical protein
MSRLSILWNIRSRKGTICALIGTNITGTAAGLTAGTATNAINVTTTVSVPNASCSLMYALTDSTKTQGVLIGGNTLTYNPAAGQVSLSANVVGASISFGAHNGHTGGGATAAAFSVSGTNGSGTLLKACTGYTANLRTIRANDLALYNPTGNIDIVCDNATGNINLAAGSSSTAQLMLLPSGNVGIGTSTPANPLSVVGAISGTTTITVPNLNSTAAQTTLTGTAGTAVCSQPFQGSSYKKVIIFLNGYTDTSTQIYTFPVAFTNTPYVYGATGVVSGATVTTTTARFTTTAQSGLIFIEGY